MAGNDKSNMLIEFQKSGIYRLPITSPPSFFLDPVRILNCNYSRFMVSPSSYYSRFFTSTIDEQTRKLQQQQRIEGEEDDNFSGKRKRKRNKKKSKQQCYSLNDKELLAEKRHKEIRGLLVKAHEELLREKELLDVIRELNCGNEGFKHGVELNSGATKEEDEEVSFIELGRVWQAPFYEIALHPPNSNNRNPKNGADSECGFNFIMIDPPWENRSAYQKSKYPTLPNRHFLSLPIKKLTHSSGALVALWVTNREKLRNFVENELFPAWGVRYVATIYWLKVKADGSLICDLDLFHHRPYECLLLGYSSINVMEDSELLSMTSSLNDRVIMTIPGDYSRKPPVADLLLEYVPGPRPNRCIELFAREMIAGWTSWGNEPLHFQDIRFFQQGQLEECANY